MNSFTEQSKKHLEVLTANVMAVKSVVAMLRGTIGPQGLDVMLVDEFGSYTCTNDGVEILSNIKTSHPVSRLLISAAKAQEAKLGDGTTSLAILIDSILSLSLEKLRESYSAVRLIKGLERGIDLAIEELKKNAKPIRSISDPQLQAIARISARADEEISGLLIQVLERISQENGPGYITAEDFELSESIIARESLASGIREGFFLKKKAHFNHDLSMRNIQALFLEGAFEPEPIPSEAISTSEGVKKYENNIQALMETAKRIVKAGVRAIFVDSSMQTSVEEFFVREGVFVLTMVKKSDLKTLRRISDINSANFVTGLVSRQVLINSDIDQIKSRTGLIKDLTFVEELGGYLIQGAKYYSASIVISAETTSALQERERIAIDSAKSLQSALGSGYVLGSGIAELNIADSLSLLSKCSEQGLRVSKTAVYSDLNEDLRGESAMSDSVTSLTDDAHMRAGIEIVSSALKSIFLQIIENAGFKIEEIHINASPENKLGLDLNTGELVDLEELGILDSLAVKISALRIAKEVCSQILRINLLLQSK